MALDLIEPFCYREYRARTRNFASWLANHVQSNETHGRTGWIAWFMSFASKKHPNIPRWREGVLGRTRYPAKLRDSLDDNDVLIRMVNEIIVDFHKMGKPRGYPVKFADEIREALTALENELDDLAWSPEKLYDVGTMASMSKVYQMLDPHRWTIYDSRVATALACLVRRYWDESGQEMDSGLIRFPVPSRQIRGWKRPQGFHSCSGSRQACLGFIYASWLLRQIAEVMRSELRYGIPPTADIEHAIQPLDGNWQVYHLEMALWMLGDENF